LIIVFCFSESVAKKDIIIGEREAFLDSLRAKRLHLEETLRSVDTEVTEVRQRRQRMSYLEDVLKKEAQLAEDEARAATSAADKLLRKLERDAAKMKSKVIKTKATVEHRKENFVKTSNAKANALSKEIAKAEVLYSKIAKGITGNIVVDMFRIRRSYE
jgi:rubrerythrin